MDYKNLYTRTITGILLVAIILTSIMWNDWSFGVVFLIITYLTTREFHILTKREKVYNPPWCSAVAGALLFIAYFFKTSGQWSEPIVAICWITYGLYVCGLVIYGLYRKNSDVIYNWSNLAFVQVYVALPLALLSNTLFFKGGHTPILVLALFLIIWTNDSCAYMFGSLFGKHPLFKRISPKKSWEGFIGGNIGALLMGMLISFIDSNPHLFFIDLSSIATPTLSFWEWMIFTEIVVIFGTFGDLIESQMKRTLDVKDSGRSIPGHGGWLDRFDSLLLASPMITFYLYLIILE